MAPHLNGRYFVDDHEIPEPQAANRWFSYAQQHGIEVARAISVWEDAATLDGETSRATVAGCGIRIVPPEV